MVTVRYVTFSAKTQICCAVVVIVLAMVLEVATLNGPNVCMVKQKYNITKRVKYRAPMSVRTYEWCMSLPPRCSKYTTEMRDLTRLETEERTAEVAVCCPGYKMRDVSCVPICPNGRTGHGCSEECPVGKWGPNCVNTCPPCSDHGSCSSITGECSCQEGWQGERCESRMSSTTSTTTTTTATVEELLTKKPATKPTITSTIFSTTKAAFVHSVSIPITSRTTPVDNTLIASVSRVNLVESSRPGNTTTKVTTLMPQSTSVPSHLNTKNNIMSKNISSTNKTLTLENTTRKTTILTTPVTSTLMSSDFFTTTADTMTPKSNPIQTSTNFYISGTESLPIIPQTTENYRLTESSISDKSDVELKQHRTAATNATSMEYFNPISTYTNITTLGSTEVFKPPRQTTQIFTINSINNMTEPYQGNYVKEVHVEIKTTPVRIVKTNESFNIAVSPKTTAVSVFTEPSIITTAHVTTLAEGHTKAETMRRPDATIRYFPTTVKFKPKEIWIRPAQKGENFADSKKINHDLHLRHRVATNKDPAPSTTPKTIIVSIIPTSVSYATFRKIALTTVPLLSETTNMTFKPSNKSAVQESTRPMSIFTTASSPLASKLNTFTAENTTKSSLPKTVNASKSNSNFVKVAKTFSTLTNTGNTWRNKSASVNGTNSMTSVTQNLNTSYSITPTIHPTNFNRATHKPSFTMGISTVRSDTRQLERIPIPPTKTIVTAEPQSVTIVSGKTYIHTTEKARKFIKTVEKTNVTKTQNISNAKTNKITTESPDDEETFHILTEPEHITAVMEGKGHERTSVDLISVISIAGGIMMAMITVAVIIVMMERCRRPRYEDVRKMNDIHMQVMIDNNDVPPPYVRSIFHTPLPDPPTSEKCHYQPLSTLDRNLKQFMRPVVVQTISPIMLENFRGILECHYDHLPRRSHDFEVRHKHCSIPPPTDDVNELTRLRPCSIADSTIDALKCEARLDVLDSTTSEPLYAEIPCWRPPSEHAIEIMNLNGEAVTEL